MNPSQPFLKMVIKLLLLLILFVCMFLISTFLYSARYWPDVYNYINANITIKRIPTISELDIQIIEVGGDYTTEIYTTTDSEYFEISTVDDFDIDEFMKDELAIRNKVKRNIIVEEMKDYKELPSRGIFVDYIFLEEPAKINNNENESTEKIDTLKTVITVKIGDETNTIERSIGKNTTRLLENVKAETPYKDITVKEDLIHLTTTREGYLVGEELDQRKSNNEPDTAQTEISENNYDDQQYRLRDLVDERNLSTRSPQEVEMVSGFLGGPLQRISEPICHDDHTCEDFTKIVFPWIATIFIKNETDNSQFQYICDGALLSEKVILTSGRCMLQSNKRVETENVLVFLGKRNLQSVSDNEKLYRITEVVLHQNFTTDVNGTTTNDLALLTLESPATLEQNIQSACLHFSSTGELEEAATTAWGTNGPLLPIFFEKEKSEFCYDKDDNIFCATYGLSVALCPSHGGVYVTKRSSTWCLEGVSYEDPTYRGLCFNKNVLYTSLKNYSDWIDDIVNINKNIL